MDPGLKMIHSLVRQGENDHIEFKRKVAHPEKIVKEVVAFANADGGHLLIGVSDNGDIPGVKFPDEEEYAMTKAILELCKPRIDFDLEFIPLSESEDKAVLHYQIRSGSKKPYYAKEKQTDQYGIAYFRIEDRSVKASRELKEILKRTNRKKGTSFRYGEKEQFLMQYLEENEEITLSQFQAKAGISKYQASRKLILLVAAQVLEIIPREKEDLFVLKSLETSSDQFVI